ncbi:DUF4955 domain-containing protein [Vibrio harveyi]|uniref:DUF4955 domain-containing protein n=1 Tax=Vibrio harveyi TaxID=669 RepID=UPI000682B72A|nr:DUF4955 domain-containing protein [Vibrio harveyi]PNM51066.1 DUF4955 domain-containing protein [Vibrio harveyi]
MRYKIGTLSVALLLVACNSESRVENTSQYWTDFVASRDSASGLLDTSTTLPEERILQDYSFAGYKFSDTPLPAPAPTETDALYHVFNVQDFGAIPNDSISDKAAIKATIEAMKQSRTTNPAESKIAVLYFPEGTYIINNAADDALIDPDNVDDIKNKQPIFVDLDNVVVKGDGVGKTVLKMDTYLQPENPSKKWTTPHMFQLGARSDTETTAATIELSQTLEGGSSFSVQVDSSEGFSVGDSVQISALIQREPAINDAISPYLIEYKASAPDTPVWTNLVKGLDKREKHTIAAIDGNVLTFSTPVAHTLDQADAWQVKKVTSYENVGIENMTISGNWHEEFVHHESALHDSGYSLLALNRVHDSWVRNIELRDFNQGGVLWNTYNVTVDDVTLSGTPGHLAFTIMYGNYNLIENITDNSHAWHAPGVSKYSIANVYKNSQYAADSSIDLHGEQSMHNLFDNMKGGWIYGRWGASSGNQPNHLKGLTFWNPVNTGVSANEFMFMKDDGIYGRVIMPYIIGMTGSEFSVAPQAKYINTMIENGTANYSEVPDESLKQANLESIGTAVEPASLFDAQLNLRHAK